MRRIIKPQQAQNSETIDQFWARRFNISQFLFDKQLAFVEDPEPYKVAVCSRRAGKTVACAAHLLHVALNNRDVVCLYITLSAANAKKLIWKEFKKIVRDCKLEKEVLFNEVELSISVVKNGSTIYLSGAKDKSEIEKFRGMALKICYLDECQSFKAHIEELIDDVIAPALLDHAGELCLIGTPGPVPTGYFHECATNEKNTWSKHRWTYFDNPHIPLKSGKTHQQGLDRELKRRGLTVDSPGIQREYFGKWVLDSDSLLIRYTAEANHYIDRPPHIQWNYILGIDVGFKDADALAVLAWSEQVQETYLVEEVLATKQGLTELVDQVQALRKKYDIAKIVMDMGGLGKKLGEEMIRRYLIPVEAAEKQRKMENIELLNDALRSGRFKAKHNSRFAQDCFLVEIDPDKSTPDRIAVSNRYHSDIIDAVLYAFKLSPAYAYEKPKEAPKYGSKEWAEAQIDEMWEGTLERLQQEKLADDWFKGSE